MLVIIWAFVRIAVKQAGNPTVVMTTWLMMAIVVLMLLVSVWARACLLRNYVAPFARHHYVEIRFGAPVLLIVQVEPRLTADKADTRRCDTGLVCAA